MFSSVVEMLWPWVNMQRHDLTEPPLVLLGCPGARSYLVMFRLVDEVS